MTPCARCSLPTDPAGETGTLYLAPPHPHTLAALRALVERLGATPHEPAPDVLGVPLTAGLLARLLEGCRDSLSLAELRDTRSSLSRERGAPTLADLAAVQPLARQVARARGEWFTAMLAEDRLTTHFQPIVRVDRPGEVFAHECLLRGVGASGELVPPGLLFEAARESDLLFPLDRAARLKAIETAVVQGLVAAGTSLFINFNPTSIYNPRSCLRSTVGAIAASGIRPERIVFEVVESDHVEDPDSLVRITEFYRDAGFQIALDDLGSGYGSLNLLGRLKPDFVKLDMQLIRGVDLDPYKAQIVSKLLEMARDLGALTVAEGIQTEGEWRWARDHGAGFVQGYLFARPAASPGRPFVPADAA